MRIKIILAFFVILITHVITGCQTKPNANLLSQSNSPLELNRENIQQISTKACHQLDEREIILPLDNKYKLRLNRIANTLTYSINNIAINYQVYLNPEINAWAMANGCIRINSGLMKAMTDNELQAILAHELAHIALEHKYKAFQAAYHITQSTRSTFLMIDKHLSQQQEIEADDYAFDFLMSKNIDPSGLRSMLRKLYRIQDVSNTHPDIATRLANIDKKLALLQKK